MMNIQKTGSLGKVKVAFAVSMTLLFGLTVMQCNSKLEEQVLALKEPTTSVHTSIDLPVVKQEGYVFDSKVEGAIYISIKGDQLAVNGEEKEIGDLSGVAENYPFKTPVYLRIDASQSMRKVHEVQEELRKVDLTMTVYLGKTSSGELEQIPFLLPPASNSQRNVRIPELTPEFVKENNIDLFEVDLGIKEDGDYQSQIYDFVKGKMDEPISNYVIVGQYKDDDSYGDYLRNLQLVKAGFYQLYEERAQKMFGRAFMDINEAQKSSEEAKQQYKEVRKGIPMSITTAKI